MIRKIFIVLLLASILISCNLNSLRKNQTENESVIGMEIECAGDSGGKLKDHFEKLDLPQGEFKAINDSVYHLTFSAKFESTVLKRIFNKTSMSFQETYNFQRLTGELSSIMNDLADYGSINAKKYLDFKQKMDENPNKIMEVPFFGGSHIGDFSITDTSSIIRLINQDHIVNKLPLDLVLRWSASSKSDSISLYLIKDKSIKSGLSEGNITSIVSDRKSRNNPTEFDKNGIPVKWDSEIYYEIALTFDHQGAEKFYNLTNRNIAEYIAFNINHSIFSAPSVGMPIEGDQISVTQLDKADLIRFYKLLLFNGFEKEVRIKGFEFK